MKEKISNVILIGTLIIVLFIAFNITTIDTTNLLTILFVYFNLLYKPLVIILLIVLIIVIAKKKKKN